MMQTIRNIVVRQYEVKIGEPDERVKAMSVWAINRTEAIVRAFRAEKFTAPDKVPTCPTSEKLTNEIPCVSVRIFDPRKENWSEWMSYRVVVHDVIHPMPNLPERHVHIFNK